MSTTLKLPGVFSDHMVLQRDLPLPVWGWAAPGAKVSIAVAGQSASAVTDASGRWSLKLKPLTAGGPHELLITAGDESLRRSDVLIGDVWICSGQSNMEWPLNSSTGGEAAVAAANQPHIRLIHLSRVQAMKPVDDIDAVWRVCSPTTVPTFSGVGYFFGQEIQRKTGVPIGLINTSWGGTPAESWTPLEDITANPDFVYMAEKIEESGPPMQPYVDSGNKGAGMGWAEPTFDDSNWATMDLPRTWHSMGLNIDGSMWFRRSINLPADFAGKPLVLHLGVANDFDQTYFNGQFVGAIGKEKPNWWTIEREYRIDPSLVKPGLNTLAVRVFNQWYEGGLLGPVEVMKVYPEGDPARAISIAGDWKYQAEQALPHLAPAPKTSATVLFNTMIAPLIPFGIRGAIWYQGESNAGRAEQYRTLFPTMIRSWRRLWAQGDFPFIFVQLANYNANSDSPVGSPWAELREAQSQALALPATGQAVTIDIGETKDIHPHNKRDVGLRLAREAIRLTYGNAAEPRSPMFESLAMDGGKAVVRFKFAGDGLVTRGGAARAFTIAGQDRKFHPAEATIDGSTVTLSSAAVSKPVAVRYGWAQDPACNVYNNAGLPASPFRTDDWPALTAGVK